MASYAIELDLDDQKFLEKFDRGMEKASGKIDSLKSSASNFQLGTVSGGAGGSRAGGSGGGGLSATPDPWARLQGAKDNLSSLLISGASGDEIKAATYREAVAQRSVMNADRLINGPDRGQAVKNLIYSTRFGAGGLMPLVGRTAAVFGEAGMLAGAGIMAAGAMISGGLDSIHSLGNAQNISGGRGASAGSVAAIGAFLGQSPEQSASNAERFAQTLHGGSYGAGYFRSKGIIDVGPTMTNKDPNYISAVRALADEPDDAIRQRVARDTGMQDQLWVHDLPRGERDALLNDPDFTLTPKERQESARYQAAKAKASGWFDKQQRGFASHPFETMMSAMGIPGGDILGGIMDHAAGLGAPGGSGAHTFEKLMGAFIPGGNLLGRPLDDALGLGDAKAVPGAENKRAGQQMDLSADPRTSQGMVGGGRNAAGAMPPAWRSAQLDDALYGHAAKLGSFPTYTL